jgi:hypothetical protein
VPLELPQNTARTAAKCRPNFLALIDTHLEAHYTDA